MPFKSSKLINRKKRKTRYQNLSDTQKSSGTDYYKSHRDIVIKKALHYRSQNVEKATASTRRAVSKHRGLHPEKAKASTRSATVKWRNSDPDKATASTKSAVSKYRNSKPDKATASTRRAVSKYRNSKPDKASTRRAVSKYRYLNPEKSALQTRQSVSTHYRKNTQRSRALSRTSTARSYMKQLFVLRKKSSQTSRVSYKRRAKAFNARRKQKYPLAEPNDQVMHSLRTSLEDVFTKSKVLTKCILEGLAKIPNWKDGKNKAAQKFTACKLAASHLVRLSLADRRKAVACLLGVKRDVMDQRFTCIKDFGLRCHTDCREPYFYEAGYTHDHLPECTYTSQCTNCPLRYR